MQKGLVSEDTSPSAFVARNPSATLPKIPAPQNSAIRYCTAWPAAATTPGTGSGPADRSRVSRSSPGVFSSRPARHRQPEPGRQFVPLPDCGDSSLGPGHSERRVCGQIRDDDLPTRDGEPVESFPPNVLADGDHHVGSDERQLPRKILGRHAPEGPAGSRGYPGSPSTPPGSSRSRIMCRCRSHRGSPVQVITSGASANKGTGSSVRTCHTSGRRSRSAHRNAACTCGHRRAVSGIGYRRPGSIGSSDGWTPAGGPTPGPLDQPLAGGGRGQADRQPVVPETAPRERGAGRRRRPLGAGRSWTLPPTDQFYRRPTFVLHPPAGPAEGPRCPPVPIGHSPDHPTDQSFRPAPPSGQIPSPTGDSSWWSTRPKSPAEVDLR